MSFTAEATFSFTVKNSFCYYGLDKVRTSLQLTITEIVTPKFGSFVAPIIGNQVGLMLALPATLFYGEILAIAIKKVLVAIRDLFKSLFYDLTDSRPGAPFFREVAISIAGFTAGFFSKLYFCNYAMPHVAIMLRNLSVIAAPAMGLSVPVMMLLPAITVMITPTVTFVLGDFVGYTVGQSTHEVLSHGCSLLFDEKHPLKRIGIKPELHHNVGRLD